MQFLDYVKLVYRKTSEETHREHIANQASVNHKKIRTTRKPTDRIYTDVFKARTIELVKKLGNRAEVARQMGGVTAFTVGNWWKAHLKGEELKTLYRSNY